MTIDFTEHEASLIYKALAFASGWRGEDVGHGMTLDWSNAEYDSIEAKLIAAGASAK
jgi:hypothetical protein